MRYRPRPGIVKTRICDMEVLIPSRLAFDHCKKIIYLPFLLAATWEAIVSDFPIDRLIQAQMKATRLPEEIVRSNYQKFLQSMLEQGYLIEVTDSEAIMNTD